MTVKKAEELNKKEAVASQEADAAVEYVETLIDVRRVAKVIKGGRRFGFSALVVVGDKNGKVGLALGKGREVSSAISKAFKRARKNMITVPRYGTTIPFTIEARHGSSKVLLRSASKGTGVIAGGAMRTIMEAAGIKDVLAKSLGSPNPQNVAKATMTAFTNLRSSVHLAHLRGKSVAQIIEGSDVTVK